MLKVQCIKNEGAEGGLTVGKIYDIGMDNVNDELIYIALNDIGIINIGYDRDKFKYKVVRE